MGKSRLKLALEETRRILGIPEEYLVGIVPGSDTGAYEVGTGGVREARVVVVE